MLKQHEKRTKRFVHRKTMTTLEYVLTEMIACAFL